MKRLLDRATKSIGGLLLGLFGLLSLVVTLSGICIFGGQVYIWLKNGQWVEIPLIFILALIPEGSPLGLWLNDPKSWYGLHKLVIGVFDFIPLSLFLIVIGLWVIPWMSKGQNGASKDTQK